MITNNLYFLPKVNNWEVFENMICNCARKKWGQFFNIYGRKGQPQYGIDILSSDGNIVIQCKNYLNIENLAQFKQRVQDDYIKSEALPFKTEKFVIATTLDRDTKIQDFIMQMNGENKSVEVMFWDEISSIIISDPLLLKNYYPIYTVNRNKNQLFSLAFFGVQIAELIGLTLGDRRESAMYCANLKNGVVWFDNPELKNNFMSNVNAIEIFALGDLTIQDCDQYENTDAYQWGKTVENIINQLLEYLDEWDKNFYLAGLYLGNFFRMSINDKTVPSKLIQDFLTVINKIDISQDIKNDVFSLCETMQSQEDGGVIAGNIYDKLRLVIS